MWGGRGESIIEMDGLVGEGTDIECPDLAVVELSRVYDLVAARQGSEMERNKHVSVNIEDQMHKRKWNGRDGLRW
jgi:hypothetical protein